MKRTNCDLGSFDQCCAYAASLLRPTDYKAKYFLLVSTYRAMGLEKLVRPFVGHPRGVELLGLPDDKILACRLDYLLGMVTNAKALISRIHST
jgi:hypothetical protein